MRVFDLLCVRVFGVVCLFVCCCFVVGCDLACVELLCLLCVEVVLCLFGLCYGIVV